MLCNNRKLAMTSSTPGKTRLVNHFKINDNWYLVDLPGYGYAKMSFDGRKKLASIIKDYLSNSEELVLLFVLVDSRHDLGTLDLDFINELGENKIPFAIIFTKGDKLGSEVLKAQIERNKEILSRTWDVLPEIFTSSSTTRTGKEEILDYIDKIISSLNHTD
jgi:GTP-binding protein